MNAARSDSSALVSFSPVVRALVELEVVTDAEVDDAIDASVESGREVEEELQRNGRVSRNDLIHAMLHAGHTIRAERADHLPEWDQILNDAGGALARGGVRDPDMAILALESDRVRRCYIVFNDKVKQEKAQAAVTKASGNGYQVCGVILATRPLIDSIYVEWDARQASPGEGLVAESDLQREFEELASAAYNMRASDVHITCTPRKGFIKLRIDGELQHYKDMTEEHTRNLASVIYNTLTERGSTRDGFNPDKVQDAVIERQLPEGLVRFRYSGLPIAPSGFDITLRIIPVGVSSRRKELRELGYEPEQCEQIERIFSYSEGIILIAGTTGSGKSTTMSTMLSKMAAERPGHKIRTVEEPVEYKIEGAYQTGVTRSDDGKNNFLDTLRQLMRSDPDVIGVGEIRDQNTAELAIQAARSGHLCISTIHAQGAPICYDRLVGMGVPRGDLASVGLIVGLIYQKLLPVLCDRCRLDVGAYRRIKGSEAQGILGRLQKVIGADLRGIYFRNEEGCPNCKQRGIVGQTVCAEILRPSPAMMPAVAAGDSNSLWQQWRATRDASDPNKVTGKTAFEHALLKMRRGAVCPVSIESKFRFIDEAAYGEGGA